MYNIKQYKMKQNNKHIFQTHITDCRHILSDHPNAQVIHLLPSCTLLSLIHSKWSIISTELGSIPD